MTKSLAIECIETQKQFVDETTCEAFDLAIFALEKQEPMKPLPQEMDIDGRAITPCGFCGEELPHEWIIKRRQKSCGP